MTLYEFNALDEI